MVVKSWSMVGQSLVKYWSKVGHRLVNGANFWPRFDQPLSQMFLQRGRSKVSHVNYPLTNIRLNISGQCYECWGGPDRQQETEIHWIRQVSWFHMHYFLPIKVLSHKRSGWPSWITWTISLSHPGHGPVDTTTLTRTHTSGSAATRQLTTLCLVQPMMSVQMIASSSCHINVN